jgi:hypothetical protein
MAKNRSRGRFHGGPGSSQQDATKPKPEAKRHGPEAERHGPEPRQRRTPARSRVSGGGGERDKHHTHNPRTKS